MRGSGEQGFTLIETLSAIIISTVLLGAAHYTYTTSYGRFRVQEQIAEAQQNARAAIHLMSRDIVMAGYSSASGVIFANKTSLTIQSRGTNISYSRYLNAMIGRKKGAGPRQAVAERVSRLSFKYKDGSGDLMVPDGSGNVTSDHVRQILISVTSATPVSNGYSASCTLESSVQARNLKLW